MSNTTLIIEHIDTSELIEYAMNSRKHSEAQISQVAASIREFGFLNPILINDKKTIIAGHARLMAAKKLELDKIPTVKISHLTKSQIKAYVIADNKLALNAEWDDEILSIELKILESEDFDLNLIGFSEDELNEIFEIEDEDLEDEILIPKKVDFVLIINFTCEQDQNKLFSELIGRGFECKPKNTELRK